MHRQAIRRGRGRGRKRGRSVGFIKHSDVSSAVTCGAPGVDLVLVCTADLLFPHVFVQECDNERFINKHLPLIGIF